MSLISEAVDTIRIETAFLPTIILDKPLEGGQPNPLMALLKPRITVSGRYGAQTLEPYGAPPYNWPAVQIGLIAVAVVVTLIILRKTLK